MSRPCSFVGGHWSHLFGASIQAYNDPSAQPPPAAAVPVVGTLGASSVQDFVNALGSFVSKGPPR
jgi:hypothetical protein